MKNKSQIRKALTSIGKKIEKAASYDIALTAQKMEDVRNRVLAAKAIELSLKLLKPTKRKPSGPYPKLAGLSRLNENRLREEIGKGDTGFKLVNGYNFEDAVLISSVEQFFDSKGKLLAEVRRHNIPSEKAQREIELSRTALIKKLLRHGALTQNVSRNK